MRQEEYEYISIALYRSQEHSNSTDLYLAVITLTTHNTTYIKKPVGKLNSTQS